MTIPQRIQDGITNILQTYRTPFYVYDCENISRQCRLFDPLSNPSFKIHYATVANIHPTFLHLIMEQGIDVAVSSLNHLEKVLGAGYEPPQVMFTAAGLDDFAIKKISHSNVFVNLDSIAQFNKWKHLFPEAKVGVRVNIIDQLKQAGFTDKHEHRHQTYRIGFDKSDLETIKGNRDVIGLHLYAGKETIDYDFLFNGYEIFSEYISYFPSLEYLNFGGGFVLNDSEKKENDFVQFLQKFKDFMYKISDKHQKNIQYILEPGRFVAAKSGYFVCKVTDVRQKNNLFLINVDATSSQFSNPLLNPEWASHPIVVIRNGKILSEINLHSTTISGCSSYTKDIFANKVELPELQINDLLLFGNAGAYCASAYMEFLGFSRPQEFFL